MLERKIVVLLMIWTMCVGCLTSGFAAPTGMKANWLYEGFDNNIKMMQTPDVPNHLDVVNVSISAVEDQPIHIAEFHLKYRTVEGVSTSYGGDSSANKETRWRRLNASAMYYLIPSEYNIGGTTVTYYVVVYDTALKKLTSAEKSYTVYQNGSWRYRENFEKNIELDYTPKKPWYNEDVKVTITSIYADVGIAKAYLHVVVRFPNIAPSEGTLDFKSINKTSMHAVIPQYPGDTNVTFWVAAYDKFGNEILSTKYYYQVSTPPITSPYYRAWIFVHVFDVSAQKNAVGAEVTIKNATWSWTNFTNELGYAWYPPGHERGVYNVTVRYKGEMQSKTIEIPNPEGYTLEFRLNATLVPGFVYPTTGFFEWYIYLWFAIALVLLFGAVFYIYPSFTRKLDALKKAKKGVKIKGQKIAALAANEIKSPYYVNGLALFGLAITGTLFIPFYPPWAIIAIAFIVGAIGIRYPFASLLTLVIFVTAAAGYQSAEFSLIFLVFAIIILFCALFDWKFGALALFAIFLGRYGLAFVVPAVTAILYSGVLALAVAAISGVFIIILIAASTYNVLGFFISSPHLYSVMLFTKPMKMNFTLTDFMGGLGAVNNANVDAIAAVFQHNFAISIVPFLELVMWCAAFYVLAYYLRAKPTVTYKQQFSAVLPATALLVVTPVLAAAYLSFAGKLILHTTDLIGLIVILIAGTIAVMYATMLFGMSTKKFFGEYFESLIKAPTIGTRIAEMPELEKTTFQMVGGLKDVKAEIRDSIIVPLLKPEFSKDYGVEPPKGIMLFGPPGCGKTLLMKALATELNVDMLSIKCSDLMSKWYGESEGRVAELFVDAKKRRPCILFLDELDAITKRRDMYAADDVTPRILSIILSELDGLEKATGIVIVGSTNKPELVDPALLRPGRFDKIIYVPPPDFEERIEILKIHLIGKPVAPDIDLTEIAKRTARYSGADIANLTKEAATIAMRRALTTNKPTLITMADFRQVLPQIKPSITLRMKEEYEKLKLDYERKMYAAERVELAKLISWSDIANLNALKDAFRQHIEIPLKRPELVETYDIKIGGGIFLYGPPGCGKTTFVNASAGEFNVKLQLINSPEIVSPLPGRSEDAVREAFSRARENQPAILFFDRIDALASPESMQTPEVKRAVDQLFVEIDKLNASKDKVAVVVATNVPTKVDASLFTAGRFDKIFYIPPPDYDARKQIFELNLKTVPKAEEIDTHSLAVKTDGYSGGDIVRVIEEAKRLALQERIAAETELQKLDETTRLQQYLKGMDEEMKRKYGLKNVHLENALIKIRSSITADILKEMKKFSATYKMA